MAIYRLPFPAEPDKNTWTCSGNWDVGGAHGPGNATDPADGQCYAYDIGHATGAKVLAARAGTVIDRDDSVADDTNPPLKGSGNYVWIRHADNTIAAYLHMQSGSVRVTNGQWVPQGYWIGNSGATGNTDPQPNPHLHFEVRTAAEPGSLAPPGFGTSLLVHFEDKTRSLFRPAKDEKLSGKSNNVEGDYRQDFWRHCGKCGVLYFAGNPGSTCPAGKTHSPSGTGNYTLSVDAWKPQGQTHWRYCTSCRGLFFGDSPKSACPAKKNGPHTAGASDYALTGTEQSSVGQSGWAYCRNCAALWFKGGPSLCPATNGAHSTVGSGDYRLHATADDWQRNWRACGTCGCLYFGDNVALSKCAGNPGKPHTPSQSDLPYPPNYFLQGNEGGAPGQAGWRWCRKCQCLWFGDNAGSVCAADNKSHSKIGSGNYVVIESTTQAPGQQGWRWCHRCQSLWLSTLGPGMKCPAGKSHAKTGGQYWVQFFGHA